MTPANLDVPEVVVRRAEVRTGRRLIFVKRTSSRAGREGERFMSPQQQADACFAYAARNGDIIIDTVDETDSVKGASVDREGLADARRRCLNGEADGIIVAYASRFARNRRAGDNAIHDLVEAGKSFIAVKEGIDNAGGKLSRMAEKWLGDILLTAQWEREDLAANWLDVSRRCIEQGRSFHASYGYRKGEDGRLKIHQPEARWVRFIFEKRGAGWRWSRIFKELNKKKVKPPRPRSEKTTPSTQWVHQHLTYIINNRVYLGEVRRSYKDGIDFVNTKAHEPIITEAQWAAAHRVRSFAGRSDQEGEFYLLRGLVRCASCGGRMRPENRREKEETVRYYRCRKTYTWGVCKAPAMVRADELEAEVVEFFEDVALGWYRTTNRKATAQLNEALAEVAAATAELEAFTSATAAAVEKVGADVFAQPLAERVERLAAAQEAERVARSAALGADLPKDLASAWDDHDDDARATVIGRVIYCVAVKPAAVSKRPDPAKGRMKIWVMGDRDCPVLPGRRVGKRARGEEVTPNRLTPIEF